VASNGAQAEALWDLLAATPGDYWRAASSPFDDIRPTSNQETYVTLHNSNTVAKLSFPAGYDIHSTHELLVAGGLNNALTTSGFGVAPATCFDNATILTQQACDVGWNAAMEDHIIAGVGGEDMILLLTDGFASFNPLLTSDDALANTVLQGISSDTGTLTALLAAAFPGGSGAASTLTVVQSDTLKISLPPLPGYASDVLETLTFVLSGATVLGKQTDTIVCLNSFLIVPKPSCKVQHEFDSELHVRAGTAAGFTIEIARGYFAPEVGLSYGPNPFRLLSRIAQDSGPGDLPARIDAAWSPSSG
jgi:hypothetical protein